jgi:hypothetical protein
MVGIIKESCLQNRNSRRETEKVHNLCTYVGMFPNVLTEIVGLMHFPCLLAMNLLRLRIGFLQSFQTGAFPITIIVCRLFSNSVVT